MNKRGQELSTSTIILIILGIIVLVLLILGFTMGWSNILPFIKSNNIDSISQNCEIACTTQADFEWCSSDKEIRIDKAQGEKLGLADKGKYTCEYLSTVPNLGIEGCPSITCPETKTCSELVGVLVEKATGCTSPAIETSSSETTDTQICCVVG